MPTSSNSGMEGLHRQEENASSRNAQKNTCMPLNAAVPFFVDSNRAAVPPACIHLAAIWDTAAAPPACTHSGKAARYDNGSAASRHTQRHGRHTRHSGNAASMHFQRHGRHTWHSGNAASMHFQRYGRHMRHCRQRRLKAALPLAHLVVASNEFQISEAISAQGRSWGGAEPSIAFWRRACHRNGCRSEYSAGVGLQGQMPARRLRL